MEKYILTYSDTAQYEIAANSKEEAIQQGDELWQQRIPQPSIITEKEALNFLKGEVDKYCNGDGRYEVYWDYRDRISSDQILEAIDFMEQGKGSWQDCWCEALDVTEISAENEFIDCIFADARKIDSVSQYFDESVADMSEIYDMLEEAGYKGVDLKLDELLSRSKYKVNLTFATKAELNYDMGSIVNSYGNDYVSADYEYADADDFDNALTYLVHQQGYSIKDVLDCNDNQQRTYSDFIESVSDEVRNNPSDGCTELCALVEMNGLELLDLASKRVNFRSMNPELCEDGYIKLETNTMIGLFNDWTGGGSTLEIQLEKPFVVPVDMVRGIQVEGASKNAPQIGAYTVNDVYGLVGSCWKDTLTYTNDKPELHKESLADVLRYAKKLQFQREYGKENNDKAPLKDRLAKAQSKADEINSKATPSVDDKKLGAR